MPSVKIPYQDCEFQDYIDIFFKRTSEFIPAQPYVLQEFIEGQKFIASAICKNGRILVLQVRFFEHLKYLLKNHHTTQS